jgi:acyl carrier protein
MDFFLLLSSLAGIFGNRSQSNYAAGNTYQDALAKYRRSQGLAASTVDLGVIRDVGFVAENQEYARHSTDLFPEAIEEDELHSIIEFLIDPRYQSEATQQLAFGFSSDAAYRQRGLNPPSILRFPMYTHMRDHTEHSQQTTPTSNSSETGPSTAALLSSARTVEEAISVATLGIRTKIASMLSLAVDAVDAANSMSSYGIDSLSAIEVRTWLMKDLGADVPFLQLVGSASIQSISEKVVSVSKLVRFEKGDDAKGKAE